MEQYYRELDLAPTATQEQIKSQYKQLVRQHHPDRFLDATEKATAEERLKTINEAYRILSSRAIEGQLVKFQQRELGLVVEPTLLDFGHLNRRQRAMRTFRVQFEKDVEGVDFIPSEENSWFRVARVSHLYGTELGSLEFEVEVDTTGLEAKTYQGWIDIYLDNTMSRMPLTLGVNHSRWSFNNRPWLTTSLATVGLALILLIGIFVLTSTNAFTQPQMSAASLIAATDTQRLLFTLQDRVGPTLYIAQVGGSQSIRYDIMGTATVAAQVGQQVAYLDTSDHQLHVVDLKSGQSQQLTNDKAPKSQLAWSPNGRQLAYLVGMGKEARIGLYDFEQGEEYRLPGEVTAGVAHFAWSPDSKTLLFDLWQADERRVYRMNWPDGALAQLTNVDSWSGVWSPDGKQILVATATGIEKIDGAGRQPRQLNTVKAGQVSWSADGLWIAYTVESDRAETTALTTGVTTLTKHQKKQLWLMRHDGTAAQQVDRAVLSYSWSPTGATLAYVTGSTPEPSSAETALLYLWTLMPNATPQLAAEVSEPIFSWLR